MSVSPSHPRCWPSRWPGRGVCQVRTQQASIMSKSEQFDHIALCFINLFINLRLNIQDSLSSWYYLFCFNAGPVFPSRGVRCPPTPCYLMPAGCQNMRWKHMSRLWSVKMSVCAPPEIFVSNGWLFTKYPSLNISINLHEFDTQKPSMLAASQPLEIGWRSVRNAEKINPILK